MKTLLDAQTALISGDKNILFFPFLTVDKIKLITKSAYKLVAL